MKHKGKGLIAVMATVLILILLTCFAYAEETEDRTLSPYFFVKSDDPETDRLPLKSTTADVSIAGVIADVKVTQVYRNEGRKPLEAIYVFPGSTRAAVYKMKMIIGERVIEAEIKKKDDARKIYEDAKHQGKSASLLEQHRPNVFQMNVANIMPRDEIKVELSYTELIVPEDRVYEFAYPTVVGPRYSNTPAGPNPELDKWVSNPYLHEGEKPTYDFDIRVKLAAGLPIAKIYSPSHKVHVAYRDKSDAEIFLDNWEKKGENRDYILQYRLDGDRIQTGLLLYKGKDENFFLLMGQPPKRVAKAEIPGREYVFIVDVSGSMHGFPLEISKKLLKNLIGNLRPTDVFNVVLFAGSSSVMSERSLPATADNIQKAIAVIDRQRGRGGTELLQALQTALSLPRSGNYSRTVIIATDGEGSPDRGSIYPPVSASSLLFPMEKNSRSRNDMKILVAYDGTLNSKRTLKYGIDKIKEMGGRLTVLHVFNSPLFIGYDSIPDAEDISRKEAHHHIEEAKRIINESGSGINVKLIQEEGHPEDEIKRCAVTENVDLILAPPGYKSIIKSSPCPVSIVPGNILVPVDNTNSVMHIMDRVIKEAKATGSKVVFLGIVPIHLYNKWEKKEIEEIKKETSFMLKKASKTVRAHGIETEESIRAGYPDEEILKTAGDYHISMIMMPEIGEAPSELGKAGAIISEGSRTLSNKPLVLVPTVH